MNLYLIRQKVNNQYDTYDSAVVRANTAEEAVMIHPGGKRGWDGKGGDFSSWADSNEVTAELIGVSFELPPGVICASFNAG